MDKKPTTSIKDKKTKKPKKGQQTSSQQKGTKQVIKKGLSNIQIQIDLSKRKTVLPRKPSQSTDFAEQKRRVTYPQINLPPPAYAFQSPSSSSSSMIDALNLIIAQNKRYENALRNETKKENIITGEKQRENQPTLADEINKNVGTKLQDLYGVQLETPTEKSYEEEEEEEEEEPSLSLGEGQRSLGDLLRPKSIYKMNLIELVEYANNRYDINPYFEVEGKGGGGKSTQKHKTKKQLIAEIEEKQRLSRKIGY